MDMMECINTIAASLNQLKVSGREDIERVLRCMMAIDRMVEIMSRKSEPECEPEKTEGGED